MSAAHPTTTGEKDAASWAEKFTLEEALAEARKLRDEEADVSAGLQKLRQQLEPLNARHQRIEYRIEALKHKLTRDL